jgi:hypothetical protein
LPGPANKRHLLLKSFVETHAPYNHIKRNSYAYLKWILYLILATPKLCRSVC